MTSFKLVTSAKITFPDSAPFRDNGGYDYECGGDTSQPTYGVIKISIIKLLKIKNQQLFEPTHFMQKKVEAQRCSRVLRRGKDTPTSEF